MINRTTLLAYLRRAPFGNSLSTAQIDGINRLLDTCIAEGVTDRRQVAYVLATVFHETGGRMQPVRETFAASDAQAKARLEAAWLKGQLGTVAEPYWRDGWFGRGEIQLTHEVNYRRLGGAIGVDLVANPAQALNAAISSRIAVIGMRDGLFVKGHNLVRYFPPGGMSGPVEARRIVNGSDKAQLIAGYWRNVLDALVAADEAKPQPADVSPADALPDDKPVSQSGSIGTVAVTTGAGAASALVAGISNPWAFAAFVLILIAGGVGLWLLLSGRITLNRSKPA